MNFSRNCFFFSEELVIKGENESYKRSDAGINRWTYKNIFKSMTVPFIEGFCVTTPLLLEISFLLNIYFSPVSGGTSPQQRENRGWNNMKAGIIVFLSEVSLSELSPICWSWRLKWNKCIDKYIGELLKHLDFPWSFVQLESNGDFLLCHDRVLGVNYD